MSKVKPPSTMTPSAIVPPQRVFKFALNALLAEAAGHQEGRAGGRWQKLQNAELW